MANPRPTDDYSWSSPGAGLESAEQSRQQQMSDLRRTTAFANAYRESERQKLQRRADQSRREREAAMESERKKRASNWSNWAAMGASLGSFIPGVGTALGAGIGGLLGAGKAWASGGDPFDIGAQFQYLDPGMVSQAAMMSQYSPQAAGATGETIAPDFGSDKPFQLQGAGRTGELGYNPGGLSQHRYLDQKLDPTGVLERQKRSGRLLGGP